MATDPPDRPTIAMLEREHGGGQPPLSLVAGGSQHMRMVHMPVSLIDPL